MYAQIDFESGLESAWETTVDFVPNLIGFLLILIIGYFVAKWIARALDAILERVGFDRAVERGGVKRALSKTGYDASDFLAKLVFYALMLFVLQLAFGVFGPNPISELIASVIAYLPKVFAAVIIIVVASAIAAAVREIIDATLSALDYGRVLANAAGVAILAVGLFAALVQLEIAEPIVIGLFYAILAVIAGSAIVAIGGGGIVPMRLRWERALTRMDEESTRVKDAAEGASDRIEARARERHAQVQDATGRS